MFKKGVVLLIGFFVTLDTHNTVSPEKGVPQMVPYNKSPKWLSYTT